MAHAVGSDLKGCLSLLKSEFAAGLERDSVRVKTSNVVVRGSKKLTIAVKMFYEGVSNIHENCPWPLTWAE